MLFIVSGFLSVLLAAVIIMDSNIRHKVKSLIHCVIALGLSAGCIVGSLYTDSLFKYGFIAVFLLLMFYINAVADYAARTSYIPREPE
jgi:predicted MFS family arabinose efflux permease